MRGRNVFVAGGGNSAGQTALHLAKWASQVTILVRAASLADSMSDYLIRQIGATPNIDVCHHVQVADGTGTGHLQSLVLADTTSGARRSVPADALFVLIGSQPRTQWLGEAVARDQRGFILTGPDLPAGTSHAGPPAARRCRWRPACPGCSPPVTCARDRSNGSPPRSAKAPPPSPWYTATWHEPPQAGKPPPGQHPRRIPASTRPGLSRRPGDLAYAHRPAMIATARIGARKRHKSSQSSPRSKRRFTRERTRHRRRRHAATADDGQPARPRGCCRLPDETHGHHSSYGRRRADRPSRRHHHRGRRCPRNRRRERPQRHLGRCRDDHPPCHHRHHKHPRRGHADRGRAPPSPAGQPATPASSEWSTSSTCAGH